jgi:hypothetical protein
MNGRSAVGGTGVAVVLARRAPERTARASERTMDDQTKTMKAVFTVVERGQGKSIWIRIGVGFTNRDGSLNLKLDALPVSGTLQVRDWEPSDRRPDASELPLRPRSSPDPRQAPTGSLG